MSGPCGPSAVMATELAAEGVAGSAAADSAAEAAEAVADSAAAAERADGPTADGANRRAVAEEAERPFVPLSTRRR